MTINLILLFLIFAVFFIFTRVVINYGTYKEMLRMYRENWIFLERALQYGLIRNKYDEDNDDEDNDDEDMLFDSEKEISKWSVTNWERYLKYLKRLVDESKKDYYFWLITLIPFLGILFFILILVWSQGE